MAEDSRCNKCNGNGNKYSKTQLNCNHEYYQCPRVLEDPTVFSISIKHYTWSKQPQPVNPN